MIVYWDQEVIQEKSKQKRKKGVKRRHRKRKISLYITTLKKQHVNKLSARLFKGNGFTRLSPKNISLRQLSKNVYPKVDFKAS